MRWGKMENNLTLGNASDFKLFLMTILCYCVLGDFGGALGTRWGIGIKTGSVGCKQTPYRNKISDSADLNLFKHICVD